MSTQNTKRPDKASGLQNIIFKRIIPAKLQVFLTSFSITAPGPKSGERHPVLGGNTRGPAPASRHPTRAINNTALQAQQDRARVVTATAPCTDISPFSRVGSREGKQAGLHSKRRQAASPRETRGEPRPWCPPAPQAPSSQPGVGTAPWLGLTSVDQDSLAVRAASLTDFASISHTWPKACCDPCFWGSSTQGNGRKRSGTAGGTSQRVPSLSWCQPRDATYLDDILITWTLNYHSSSLLKA